MTTVVNSNGVLMQQKCVLPNRSLPTPYMVLHSGTGNSYATAAELTALAPLKQMFTDTLHIANTEPQRLSPLYNVENLRKGLTPLLANWSNTQMRDKLLDAMATQEVKFLNKDGLAKRQIEAQVAGLGETYIDPVLSYPLMGLNEFSEPVNIGIGGLFQAAKKAVKAVGTAAKATGGGVVNAAKFVKNNVQKVNPAMIAGRTAYRGLVALNLRGWATNIQHMITTNTHQKFKDKYTGALVGGNWGDLVAAVNTGKNKKALLAGISDNIVVGQLGEPTTIAASIAAATPVIAAVASAMVDAKKIADAAKPLISLIPKKKTENPVTPELPTSNSNTPPELPTSKSFFTTPVVVGMAATLILGFAFFAAQAAHKNKAINGVPEGMKKAIKQATIK